MFQTRHLGEFIIAIRCGCDCLNKDALSMSKLDGDWPVVFSVIALRLVEERRKSRQGREKRNGEVRGE